MSTSRLCLREATDRNVSKSEPLLSTRREDGLWESIETDDDDNHASAIQPNFNLAATVPPSSHKPQCSTKSVGVQTSPQPPLPAPNDLTNLTTAAGTMTETVTAVHQLYPSSLYQQPILPRGQQDSIAGGPITPDPTRRRRGRPRKTSVCTNFRNPRRSVRFSDPLALSLSIQQQEEEATFAPPPSSRDSHVFVRLLNVVIQQPENLAINTGTGTTQEYSWNNRGKGWREADRRSDEGLVQIVSLFDSLMDTGVDVLPVVLPTEEKGGARQPVKMNWDGERACFVGMSNNNQDGEILLVALGEMKDMARDPWARQFVGYMVR